MNVTMRRLSPDTDRELIAEAVAWLDEQPLYFRNCDAVWGSEGSEDYLRHMREDPQADFGVFEEGKLVAVITVSLEGKGVFNSHLMVRRGTRPEPLAIAAGSVIGQLFENGMKEGWSWLASKNQGAQRVLERMGMRKDGVERLKGQSHGRPIVWQRYSVAR